MRTWHSEREGVPGGAVLSVRMMQNWIDAPTLDHVVPDLAWSLTDEHGHLHRFADEKGRTVTQTIEIVSDVSWCYDCQDEHTETELRCTQCAAVIVPKWLHRGPQNLQIPGMIDVFVDVLHSDGSTEDVMPRDNDEHEWIVGAWHAGGSRSQKMRNVTTVCRYVGLLT